MQKKEVVHLSEYLQVWRTGMIRKFFFGIFKYPVPANEAALTSLHDEKDKTLYIQYHRYIPNFW